MDKLDDVLERENGSTEGKEEAEHDEGDGDEESEIPDTKLFNIYQRYIGEPENKVDVYLGFTLFLGGVAVGVIGFLFFLASSGFEEGSSVFWTARRIAITLAFLGLPGFMTGIVVLLPVKRRAVYAALGGGAICLAALVFFNLNYPQNWNVPSGPDATLEGIAFYSVGIATVIASMFAALVAYQLERMQPEKEIRTERVVEKEIERRKQEAEGEDVSEEQIRKDIDEAMANTDISWGGVEKKEMKKLELNTPESDLNFDAVDTENIQANTTRTKGGVDDAVSGLKNMRGDEKNEAKSESTVDDQTAALKELKKQKREKGEDDKIETGADPSTSSDLSLIDKVKDKLGLKD